MNLFDIILVTIFTISVIVGGMTGASITFLNITSSILTLILTVVVIPLSEDIAQEHISNKLMVTILSIIISYTFSVLLMGFISRKTKEVLQSRTGGLFDRVFGLWIGSIRGATYCLSIFVIVGAVASGSLFGSKNAWQVFSRIDEETYPNWLKKSHTFGIMQYSYTNIYEMTKGTFVERYLADITLPASNQVQEQVEEQVADQIKDQIKGKIKGAIQQKVQEKVQEKTQEEFIKGVMHLEQGKEAEEKDAPEVIERPAQKESHEDHNDDSIIDNLQKELSTHNY